MNVYFQSKVHFHSQLTYFHDFTFSFYEITQMNFDQSNLHIRNTIKLVVVCYNMYFLVFVGVLELTQLTEGDPSESLNDD